MSILIVDNNQEGIERLENILKKGGYHDLISAFSVNEALHKLEKLNDLSSISNINLLLINLSSDEIFQQCVEFKERQEFNDIPIIAITCSNNSLNIQKAFDSYITECISNLNNEAEIMIRIRSVLSLKYEIKRRKALERNLNDLVRQLEHTNNMLQLISSQDGLTGIANRRYFDHFLSNEWRRALRNASSISLLMIDIDFFKAYNDFYGHLEGDECLKKIAQEIQKTLKRRGDICARYGGEEFAVILPGTDIKGALLIATLIHENVIALNIKHEGSKILDFLTISIGVASEIPFKDESYLSLIKKADLALYHAKKNGRNRIDCWNESMTM
ncbi:MAG TPA: diguanylate cyclase [Nitrospirae bacterium]|nr:diguanylate cyclase [Nitrospirota bacterium]